MGEAIVIASDHRGTKLKAALREQLEAAGHDVVDVGAHGDESVDYPDYAAAAAKQVSRGDVPRGIVICGSGLGVSYTANRFPDPAVVYCNICKSPSEFPEANIGLLPMNR